MKQNTRTIFLILTFLLIVSAAGAVVLAQTSAGFNLEWHVIGSGGGESTSASYHVNGTIGQDIASPPTSGSAGFTVSSGYWVFGTETAVYLPAILNK